MSATRKQIPLSKSHPLIARQASGWDPKTVSKGSHQKLTWECSTDKRHVWVATVNSRTNMNSGCPFCSNKRILKGFNDLVTTNPDIAKEANGWDPTEFSKGSSKRLSWKCSRNKTHIWIASIKVRTGTNKGCPYCSKKGVREGVKDLVSKYPKVAKQADGWDPITIGSGSDKKMPWLCEVNKKHRWEARVVDRTRKGSGCPYCRGTKVLKGESDLATKFPAIAKEADGWDPKLVLAGSHSKLKWKCLINSRHRWVATPKDRTGRGDNCPFCANKRVHKGSNDLATKFPAIAKEADGWDPKLVLAGSTSKLKWKCLRNSRHRWVVSPNNRIHGGTKDKKITGCPYCDGKIVLKGDNDLATKFPNIAKEADGWDPSLISAGSAKKLKWVCSLDSRHKWSTTPAHRTSESQGCPSCAFTGFDPNKPGYLYFIKHSSWKMLQIGITNYPEDRIASHKKLGWKLIELQGPMRGNMARQWETAILRMLKHRGADLSNAKIAGKFDGYSEAWSKTTFIASSIGELKALAKSFKEN
jgi:DNA-directed RNA polymerase subunit RPC12/RpoP